MELVSPCRKCSKLSPPNCRKSCEELKKFQAMLEEIPQSDGGGRQMAVSRRYAAHE